MAIDYRIAVDWDADGYYHYHLTPQDSDTEPANVISSNAADMVALGVLAGGGSSTFTQNPTSSAAAYAYGKTYVDWTTGTNSAAQLAVGYNMSTYGQILLDNSTQYTAVLWFFSSNPAADSVNLRMDVLADSTGTPTLVATGSNFNIISGAGFTIKTITFTSHASISRHFVRVVRPSSTANVTYAVLGLMVVEGASAPTKFNGGQNAFYDNLTPLVKSVRWNVGFRNILLRNVVADLNQLRIEMNDYNDTFKPENPDTSIAEFWGQNIIVEATQDSWTTVHRMYTGYTDDVQPYPGGVYSPDTVTLLATCKRKFLDGAVARIPLQESKTTTQIIDTLLAAGTYPDGSTPTVSLSGTASTFSYAGDNWEDGTDLLRAIGDVCGGDGYAFWFGRNGNANAKRLDLFSNISVFSPVLEIDSDYIDLDYKYGADVIRNVEVAVYRRRLRPSSAPYTRVLWSHDSTADAIDLPANETIEIIARYSDEEKDKTVGARNVTSTGLTCTPDSVGITVTLDAKAQSCVISIENSTGTDKQMTALTLQGQKVISWDAVYVRDEAQSSGVYSGEELKIDYKTTAKRARAALIAEWYLDLYGLRIGRVRSFSFEATRSSTLQTHVLERGIGSYIRFKEDRMFIGYRNSPTGERLTVIGEEHHLTQMNSENVKHIVKYYTENEGNGTQLDFSRP